jgi:hypothetical protein
MAEESRVQIAVNGCDTLQAVVLALHNIRNQYIALYKLGSVLLTSFEDNKETKTVTVPPYTDTITAKLSMRHESRDFHSDLEVEFTAHAEMNSVPIVELSFKVIGFKGILSDSNALEELIDSLEHRINLYRGLHYGGWELGEAVSDGAGVLFPVTQALLDSDEEN